MKRNIIVRQTDKIFLEIWQTMKKQNTRVIRPYKEFSTPKNIYNKRICNAIHSLIRSGYLKKANKTHGGAYLITPRGREQIIWLVLKDLKEKFKKCRRKDNKWRLVVFDVPEKKRGARNKLRSVLKIYGFKRYQKSVWLYPYPIPKIFRDTIKELGMSVWVKIIIVCKIDEELDNN